MADWKESLENAKALLESVQSEEELEQYYIDTSRTVKKAVNIAERDEHGCRLRKNGSVWKSDLDKHNIALRRGPPNPIAVSAVAETKSPEKEYEKVLSEAAPEPKKKKSEELTLPQEKLEQAKMPYSDLQQILISSGCRF